VNHCNVLHVWVNHSGSLLLGANHCVFLHLGLMLLGANHYGSLLLGLNHCSSLLLGQIAAIPCSWGESLQLGAFGSESLQLTARMGKSLRLTASGGVNHRTSLRPGVQPQLLALLPALPAFLSPFRNRSSVAGFPSPWGRFGSNLPLFRLSSSLEALKRFAGRRRSFVSGALTGAGLHPGAFRCWWRTFSLRRPAASRGCASGNMWTLAGRLS